MGTLDQILLETAACSTPLWTIWYRLDQAKFHEVARSIIRFVAEERKPVGRYVISGLGVVAIGAVVFPYHDRSTPGNNIWLLIANNAWSLDAVRTAGVVALLFVVVSIIVRAIQGDWLVRFGMFAIDTSAKKVKALKKELKQVESDRDGYKAQAEEGYRLATRFAILARNAINQGPGNG